MADINLVTAIVAGVGSGIVSTLGTVAALKVHISYLKEKLAHLEEKHDHLENSVMRSHTRIDLIERVYKK